MMTSTPNNPVDGLDESHIPKALLQRSRTWFSTQVARLSKKHGDKWDDNKAWMYDYLNEELREIVSKHG